MVARRICYVDDVVLVAGTVKAAETLVKETIGNLKEVGLTVVAEKNPLDKPTEKRTLL